MLSCCKYIRIWFSAHVRGLLLNFLIQDHESEIKAIYTGNEFLESAAAGDEVGIILESTSFYAEQGGQVKCAFIFWLENVKWW